MKSVPGLETPLVSSIARETSTSLAHHHPEVRGGDPIVCEAAAVISTPTDDAQPPARRLLTAFRLALLPLDEREALLRAQTRDPLLRTSATGL
jgi:hypothetical protein